MLSNFFLNCQKPGRVVGKVARETGQHGSSVCFIVLQNVLWLADKIMDKMQAVSQEQFSQSGARRLAPFIKHFQVKPSQLSAVPVFVSFPHHKNTFGPNLWISLR